MPGGAIGAPAQRRPSSVPFVEVCGASYESAAGISTPWHSYTRKAAALMGARRFRNLALPGAMASRSSLSETGYGGVHHVLQNVTRPAAKPSGPRSCVAIVGLGFNDKAINGPNEAYAREALNTICARWQSNALFPANDASVVASGGNAAYAASTLGSGNGFIGLDAAGEKVTITVPSWFEGGIIDLGFVLSSSAAGAGTVTIDGQAATPVSFATSLTESTPGTQFNGAVRSYTLAAGAHTIVVEWTSGSLFFNYWQTRYAQDACRLLLPCQGRLATYSVFSGYTYPMNDTRIGELKTMLTEVSAPFPNARVVDFDPILQANAASFASDTVHPSELGHAMIAPAIRDAALDGLSDRLLCASVDPRPVFTPVFAQASNIGSPNVKFENSWTNFGGSFFNAGYRLADDGWVELQGVVKLGSSATATMFTLPAGYRPAGTHTQDVNGNNAWARIDVTAAGAVSAASGGSTTYTTLDGVRFPASL